MFAGNHPASPRKLNFHSGFFYNQHLLPKRNFFLRIGSPGKIEGKGFTGFPKKNIRQSIFTQDWMQIPLKKPNISTGYFPLFSRFILKEMTVFCPKNSRY